MDIERAKAIVSVLAEGIDPTTGEVLPENSVYNKGEIVRALYAVLAACNTKETKKESISKESVDYDVVLYERLRAVRNKTAEESGLKPFRVVTNKVLMHMATQKPVTKAEFLEIPGVGEYTAKKYGNLFISEINDYINNLK